MEIREFEWVAFGKKIVVLFCVGILARGFQILTVKLMEMFWSNVTTIALDALLPYQLIIFTVITVLDTYWVIRIFLAFAENSRFRGRGGGNGGRQNTGMGNMGLIIVVYLSHFANFTLSLAGRVWNTVSVATMWSCVSDPEAATDPEADISECSQEPQALIYFSPLYFNFLEFAFLFSQVFLKHLRKRRAEAVRQ